MKINSASPALAAALLLFGLWMQPALAHSGGGGGGGHSGGSRGHAFAGHAGGGGHFAAQHYASRGFAGAHAAVGRSFGLGAGVGRGAVSARVGGRAFGPGGFGRGARWGGGYWGGRFWPGVFYGAGFAWFLPVLPLYCSTFWWNNVPYYYYNDAYYTWSPTADGYVATDPPPAAISPNPGGPNPNDSPSDSYGGAAPNADAATGPASGPAGGGDNVYAYPSKGQSEDQQATDRMQCDQWAASQMGAGGGNGSPDYRRAVIACFQGRGYSAQ
jgi:hypothetical protein